MASADLRSTKRRRHDRDQSVWTASRCNRLLRQLRLHIQTLRQKAADDNARDEPKLKRKRLEELRTPIPKRPRKKYQGRNKRGRNGRVPLSEIPSNVATPPRGLRKMGETRPSAQFSSPSAIACPTPTRPQDRLDLSYITPCDDKKATKSQRRADPDDLDSVLPCAVLIPWLQLLLQSTAAAERVHNPIRHADTKRDTPTDIPNKSLISMCLRRIPDCIAAVQQWDKQENEEAGTWTAWDDANAETAMYQEVQHTFESHNDGWPPFRQLVRAHSVQIIADAATEGLVKPSTALSLAKLCVKSGCHDEAAKLIQAAATEIIQHEADDEERPKQTTAPFLQKLGGRIWSSMCWVSEDLLHESQVSVAELYSARASTSGNMAVLLGKSFWKHSLASITQRECSPKVCAFVTSALVQLALPSAGGHWSKEVLKERTMISITAGLAAAATTGECARVQRRVIHIFDTAIADFRAAAPRSLKAERCGLYLLTLARHFAFGLDGSGFDHLRPQSVEELDSIIPQSDSQITYRQTIALTCSIARACIETTKLASHAILDKLLSLLERLSVPTWFHSGLRTDGAFILAQKTKDLRDLAYAENLTTALGPGTYEKGTTMFSGWKWEAGISEWVPETPAGTTSQDVSRNSSTEPVAEANPDNSINETERLFMLPPKRPKAKLLAGRHRHSEGCWEVAAETDKSSVDIRPHDSNSKNYARLSGFIREDASNPSDGLLAAPKRTIWRVARATPRPCTTQVATVPTPDSTDDASRCGFEGPCPSMSDVAVSRVSRTKTSHSKQRDNRSRIRKRCSQDNNPNSDHDLLNMDEPPINDFAGRNAVVEHRDRMHDTVDAPRARGGRSQSERKKSLLLASDETKNRSRPSFGDKSRRQHSQPLRRTASLSSLSRGRTIGGCDVDSDDWDELG